MSAQWRIEALTSAHTSHGFSCGNAGLDDYIKRYARQDQRRDLARTFVAVEENQGRVDGYYTLAAGCVRPSILPPEETKGLPRYDVPVVLLGRLAVDGQRQGQGLGAELLLDAFKRTLRLSNEVGIRAMTVWAADENVRGFYLRYGFSSFNDDRLHLYLPLSLIRAFGLNI